MKYLTADFGSTYTKLTAIDADKAEILGTAASFTTIDTDVMLGFNKALAKLEQQIGSIEYDDVLCCSSAAGGLKMVALGLVPDLTAKAARMAASSAGAKVVKTYAFEISQDEKDEIENIEPDLVLLCGGTDGGNKEVILANAKHLCDIPGNFSIIAAGNKAASYELKEIFDASGKSYTIAPNVMPEFNKLNIEPAKKCIMDLFISRIVEAKGLSRVRAMSKHEIIPTPLAVLNGCQLYSEGTKKTEGMGELIAVDLGGATTDVYSMATGEPTLENVMIKGLPEPFNKRSVEGDLGMRYSLVSLAEEANLSQIAQATGQSEENIAAWVEQCHKAPDTLAEKNSPEQRIEEELARWAVKIAMERHTGTMSSIYTPMGELHTLSGKDLTAVPMVIGIGGIIIHSQNPIRILEGAKYDLATAQSMKPREPRYLLDAKYIFASMGLLSAIDQELALSIMKKEIKSIS